MSCYFSVSRQSKLRSRNLKIHPARLQIEYEKSSGGRWSDPVCVREVKVFGDENADLKFKWCNENGSPPVVVFSLLLLSLVVSPSPGAVLGKFLHNLEARWHWDKQGHGGNHPRSCLIVLKALICRGSAGNQVGLFSAALCLPAAQFHVWAKRTSSPIRKMPWC